jgi:hypothetical protein
MPAPEPIPDLLKAVNEASGKAFALWITFLTVGTYLAIAIGTTTHLQLLLASPIKMPLLGVDLPLFAFYGFAPPLFVVLHLYVLMQLYLLARLLSRFDDDLRAADMTEQDRRRVRDQLDKFVFTQFLIGAPRDGDVRLFLRAAVFLSFVVGPVVLLLGFQLRFLPYHNIPVTYVHRVMLLLDLVLLLLLWPQISRSVQQVSAAGGWKAFCRIGCSVGIFILLVWFSVFMAVVPGEWADLPLFRDWGKSESNQTFHFIEGGSSGGSASPERPFSQSLSLPGQRLVEQEEDKLKNLEVTLSLSRRDLRQAFLYGIDLRKADLSDADLRDAGLFAANLRGIHLDGADLTHADLFFAKLADSHLPRAKLVSTVLVDADLARANLRNANLTDANLMRANLTDADLTRANLTDARNLTQEQLNQACGTETTLPPGLTLKPCPPK